MSKLMKKMVSIGLAFVMLVCTTCGNITNVQAATKGNTESGVYCTVKISSNLLAKKGRQYATVKLSTYSKWPAIINTYKTVTVTLRDGKGKYICTFIARGGDKLQLGDDHTSYRIYVNFDDHSSFSNLGQSQKWKISSPKNCSIS